MTTSTAPTQQQALRLGLTSQREQVVLDDLPVRGEMPAWLTGSMLRTGPAAFEVGNTPLRHWFDGTAKLHRFTIGGDGVSYACRFLEGRAYESAEEKGEMVFGEFATDPCRSLFKRAQAMFSAGDVFTDNANVNVTKLGDRFIAMTETPMPVQFDPETLAAAGISYEPPGHLTTAHPHGDRATGSMLNYAAKLGPRSSYRFFELGPEAKEPTVIGSLPVREPAYMHSFGLSERWLVLAEFPFVVNPLKLALAGKPYIENYRWKPELGTRFTLVDRYSGEARGGFETDACFAFHHVNSYEEGDEVVVDVCVYEDAGVIDCLYLDAMRAGNALLDSELARFRLNLKTGAVRREKLADGYLELPRINYGRCNARPYRYVWGVRGEDGRFPDQIVKVDVEDGATLSWARPGHYPSEPVFVAAPGADGEDGGVLLSIVLDVENESSYLMVLDATNLEEVATASAPHAIPFGFHGQFMRD